MTTTGTRHGTVASGDGAESALLDGLNPAQKAIVAADDGHILVLAGAGSGKTRVLTRRMAWLNMVEGALAGSILAVTFTNKAAGEMRQRLMALPAAPGTSWNDAWVGTFHGIAHRILRMQHQEAGLDKAFQIIDAEDSTRLIRRIMVDMGLDPKEIKPPQVSHWISRVKDDGIPPGKAAARNREEAHYPAIYGEYDRRCRTAMLLDFSDLLLRLHELFAKRRDVLGAWQKRFGHILVDEFQDTNSVQYELVGMLAAGGARVFVVGDDSQSIYGWRGAKPGNMQRFLREYRGAQLLRLEQNYRSFPAVLRAANALIAHNSSQIEKSLWTASEDKEPIRLYQAGSEVEEAEHVVQAIADGIRAGDKASDFAVLYRTNAQSRIFEEHLIARRMAYRITGGLRFFERAEVKDALAWMRLALLHDDDVAFDRIVNTPPRGLGEKTVSVLREAGNARRCSLWEATSGLLGTQTLAKRQETALQGFQASIVMLGETLRGAGGLGEKMEAVLAISGLREFYDKESSDHDRGVDRVANLEELVSVAERFAASTPEGGNDPQVFLTHAALEASEEAAGTRDAPAVELMTLHSSKGLEFKHVFLVGMEEGLFPSARSVSDPDGSRLEEERRLAYVGVTRAMQHLTLTLAAGRRLYGQSQMNPPSRFLAEIPREILEVSSSKPAGGGTRRHEHTGDGAAGGNTLRPGRHVRHTSMGDGWLIRLDGRRAQVAFKAGARWVGTVELTLI